MDNLLIEQRQMNNQFMNSKKLSHHSLHQNHQQQQQQQQQQNESSNINNSFGFNSNMSSSVTKLKRSLSHKRKFAKKLPLIKKELDAESSIKQCTERLIQAIVDCNLANLRQSLENGANVNTKYNNWSLLHYACSMIDQAYCGTDQHLEVIRLLLENGAQINSQDEDRWTPLHLACQLGVTRVISYLIKRGADRNACTIENLRPIDLVEPDNYIALSILISTSVNCNERCL